MDHDELCSLLALANEFKEGDLPVGGTRDERVRAEARAALTAVRVGDLRSSAVLADGVGTLLDETIDGGIAGELARMTLGEIRARLLDAEGVRFVTHAAAGLSSEAIAGAVKLMSDDELSRVARSIHHPLGEGPVAVGAAPHLGSRIQPNSAGDDPEEILFSILEGLSYGCGDVILGLNPASDDLDTIVALEELLESVVARLALPTRTCVLSDIVKQDRARARTHVDVGFQSLAGTSRALRGIVGLEAAELREVTRGFAGLYFETGQGSEVTNGAAEGLDMVTLEARTYGLARAIARSRPGTWMIVNDVAGFIGPEVFRSAAQLERACLEDSVMAKLHGLTMGLDVCSTFHMGIEPHELARRTESIALRAAPAYLMAVAGNADPMLGYLTTSFRDHPRLRRLTGRDMASAMRKRLADLGALDAGGLPRGDSATVARLYSAYRRAGGDTRGDAEIAREGESALARLRERGLDVGHGHGAAFAEPAAIATRLDALYRHARRALYARIDSRVVADACPRHERARTLARDREDYLSHPPSGERLLDRDAARIAALPRERRPGIQLVISDGLNADAANEHLRTLLPRLRHRLSGLGVPLGPVDVVLDDARVRAGYHVGALLDPDVVVHLIGERPGTGLNTLSAYLTYGRESDGAPRWSPALEHSATTAIAGIHPRGTPPGAAADEIANTVARILAERRSGVALGTAPAAPTS